MRACAFGKQGLKAVLQTLKARHARRLREELLDARLTQPLALGRLELDQPVGEKQQVAAPP